MDKLQKLINAMEEKVQKAQKELDEITKLREATDPNKDDESDHLYYRVYADHEIEAQLKVNRALSEMEWILSVIA